MHIGQHHNCENAGAFSDGLGLPRADFILGIGSGSHEMQTGAMLEGMEEC